MEKMYGLKVIQSAVEVVESFTTCHIQPSPAVGAVRTFLGSSWLNKLSGTIIKVWSPASSEIPVFLMMKLFQTYPQFSYFSNSSMNSLNF